MPLQIPFVVSRAAKPRDVIHAGFFCLGTCFAHSERNQTSLTSHHDSIKPQVNNIITRRILYPSSSPIFQPARRSAAQHPIVCSHLDVSNPRQPPISCLPVRQRHQAPGTRTCRPAAEKGKTEKIRALKTASPCSNHVAAPPALLHSSSQRSHVRASSSGKGPLRCLGFGTPGHRSSGRLTAMQLPGCRVARCPLAVRSRRCCFCLLLKISRFVLGTVQ